VSKKEDPGKLAIASRLAHGVRSRWAVSEATDSLSVPIFQNSAFAFRSLADADEIMARGGRTFELGEDYVYSRGGNPTERELERMMACLEGGEDAVVYSTGMAAIAATVRAIVHPKDHIIIGRPTYGETHWVFAGEASRSQVDVDFVDLTDWNAFVSAVRDNTRAVFVETPSNPTLGVTDLRRVAAFCRERDIVSIVDNTFATGLLQRPLDCGCHVVVQSLSKYISGHGDATGGAVVCDDRTILKALREDLFIYGAALKPFDAFLVLRGMRTLPLRMAKHSSTAMEVVNFLQEHPLVDRVLYPGLASSPHHDVARKQMSDFGGILSFELKPEAGDVDSFVSHLQLCVLAPSFGTPRTLIQVPARITHRSIPSEQKEVAGISPRLIRMSVGLEESEDVIRDLARAFSQADSARGRSDTDAAPAGPHAPGDDQPRALSDPG